MHPLFSESALKPSIRVSPQQQHKSGPVMSILSRLQPTLPGFCAPQEGFNHSVQKKQKKFSIIIQNSSTLHFPSDSGTDIRPLHSDWHLRNLSPRCMSPSELHCDTRRPAGRVACMVCDCHKVITNDLLSGLSLSISDQEMIYRPSGILLGFIRLCRRSVIDSSGVRPGLLAPTLMLSQLK